MGFGFSQDRISRPEATKYDAQRRQVFGSHSNLAHTWAQNNIAYGRSSDGRMFFERGTIYSYGTHFPIAMFTGHKFGNKDVVLFTSDSYSISTRKHIGHVWGALRGLPVLVITVPELSQFRITDGKLIVSEVHANAAFDALVEALALVPEKRNAAKAFLQLTGLKRRIPDNPVAWSERRRCDAATKARLEKISAAKEVINRAHIRASWESAKGDIYEATQTVEDIERYLKQLRSARLTLGKRKFPRLVASASTYIKQLETLLADWKIYLYEASEKKRFADNDREVTDYILNGPGGYVCRTRFDRLFNFAKQHRPQDANRLVEAASLWYMRHETTWRAPDEYYKKNLAARKKPITAEDWQNGAGDAYSGGFSKTLIRRKGDRLQTSRGAEAPWKLCVAAFLIAQECHHTRTTWQKNGKRLNLGNYELDRVDANGTIYAGCHTIEWMEILRLAVREIPEMVRASYPVPALI